MSYSRLKTRAEFDILLHGVRYRAFGHSPEDAWFNLARKKGYSRDYADRVWVDFKINRMSYIDIQLRTNGQLNMPRSTRDTPGLREMRNYIKSRNRTPLRTLVRLDYDTLDRLYQELRSVEKRFQTQEIHGKTMLPVSEIPEEYKPIVLEIDPELDAVVQSVARKIVDSRVRKVGMNKALAAYGTGSYEASLEKVADELHNKKGGIRQLRAIERNVEKREKEREAAEYIRPGLFPR